MLDQRRSEERTDGRGDEVRAPGLLHRIDPPGQAPNASMGAETIDSGKVWNRVVDLDLAVTGGQVQDEIHGAPAGGDFE